MSRVQNYWLSCLIFAFILAVSQVQAGADEASAPKAADLVEDGQRIDITTPRYQEFFKELRQKHNFPSEELEKLFSGLTIKKRVLELMDTQWEAKPYYEYFPRFLSPEVIWEGRQKLRQYEKILAEIEKNIGVEREIVIAIWGIETRYGRNEGAFNMFQTLNTMFDAYPRRRDFYRDQLLQFLLLCRENKVDPLKVTGSYGGAFGQTQFIPSSFREYAVDFDRDGSRDVWNSIPDILASIANYLHRYDWVFGAPIYRDIGGQLKSASLVEAYSNGRKGLVAWQDVKNMQGVDLPPAPGDKKVTIVGLELDDKGGMRYVAGYPNFQAITAWNNSNRYAMAVTELAERLHQ